MSFYLFLLRKITNWLSLALGDFSKNFAMVLGSSAKFSVITLSNKRRLISHCPTTVTTYFPFKKWQFKKKNTIAFIILLFKVTLPLKESGLNQQTSI
jgi:hypothetical protein